jgi:hypothetical protein
MDQSLCSPLQISEEMIAKVAGDDKVSNIRYRLFKKSKKDIFVVKTKFR